MHFRKCLPHSVLLSTFRPFHLTASSVAISAILFLRESSSTCSCSMLVHCSSYQELASGSLPTGCTSLSDRPASVQATQSSVQQVQGVKWPEHEASHHQRPSPKMDKLAVPALTVRIAAVVRDTVVLPNSVSKGDVRYSSTLKQQRFV